LPLLKFQPSCIYIWKLASIGFKLNTLHTLLQEDGGRLPKHVAVKILYCFYLQLLCSDFWFLMSRKIGRFSTHRDTQYMRDTILLIMIMYDCAHILQFQEYVCCILYACLAVSRLIKTCQSSCYECCHHWAVCVMHRSSFPTLFPYRTSILPTPREQICALLHADRP